MYKIYKLDASRWNIMDDFYSDIHNEFLFPSYFGRNWGAVDDCLIDIDSGEKGNIVVCIYNFDSWLMTNRDNAIIFLDVLSDRTYSYLVGGNRFITLIHSNNPKLEIPKIGAKSIHWNWNEWKNKDRGI